MRPVLGFQLELTVDPEIPSGSDADWLESRLETWVRSWYERRGTPLSGSEALQSAALPAGHSITVARETPTTRTAIVELTWQYPADGDSSALWTSRATIAADESGADLSLALSIASREFVARPFRYEVYVPRLIRELAQTGRVHLSGRQITVSPRTLSVGNVAAFVEEDLTSSARRLPLLMVSRQGATDRFPVDPAKLAAELCGLAEVWVLNDRWTAYALSDSVGPKLSCFDGGLRTYWPGFATSDDPFSHPLITHRRIQEIESAGTAIGRHLVRHLAPVGALRLADSRRAVVVRGEAARLRREAALAAVKSGTVEQLESQLLEAWDKADRFEKSWREQQERADTLETELNAVKQNFALVSAAASDAHGDDASGEAVEADVTSVLDAIRRAKVRFPALMVWRSAEASAKESRFARPDQVFRGLEAIADVAERVFRQDKTKESLGNLEDLFAERGFKYSPSDHQTTLTKYGNERTFSEGETKRLFERHITLGGGDRQNCLQIYFELVPGAKRVDVGYCGVHLPYDGMRS